MSGPNESPKLAHGERAPAPEDAQTEIDEAGWFVDGATSGMRPSVRPKSTPPTGDDEVDRWLR